MSTQQPDGPICCEQQILVDAEAFAPFWPVGAVPLEMVQLSIDPSQVLAEDILRVDETVMGIRVKKRLLEILAEHFHRTLQDILER